MAWSSQGIWPKPGIRWKFISGSTAKAVLTDNQINQKRLEALGIPVQVVDQSHSFPAPEKDYIIIDALFGSGLNRPLEGWLAQYILQINALSNIKISIDLPSGLFMDQATAEGQTIFKANYTLSFQVPKLAFYLPEYDQYIGESILLPIGLEEQFLRDCPSDYETVDLADVQKIIRPRKKYSHKGTYGHALIIGGSIGKVGAALLATRACLRAGAGLVSVHSPRVAYSILQVGAPEAMVVLNQGKDHHTRMHIDFDYKAAGLGPGMGQHEETRSFLEFFLQRNTAPLVVDADALNIISKDKSLLDQIPKGSIFTPHPKEFERLCGSYRNSYDRIKLQKELALQTQSCVLVKGAHTCMVTPEGKVYFNTTGNPGMATGGSGDVLTGILTALLSQGYSSEEACLLGSFVHGTAGDLAVREQSQEGLIAGDMISYLGRAWLEVSGKS